MSRNIKFRGWDSVNEVMLPVESINFRGGYVSLNEGDNSLTDTLEMIELMLCTGIKDKNGIEIYEGDIIQFVGESYKANGIVKYGIRRTKMINENNELGFYVGWSSELCWRRDLIFWSRKCEVIGNIYKNPELMWRVEDV